jgi:hypothetical protein
MPDRPADLDRAMAGHVCPIVSGRVREPDRSSAKAEVAGLLRAVLVDEIATWIADYVRLRFLARLPV